LAQDLTPAERLRARQAISKPFLEVTLKPWLDNIMVTEPPKSNLFKACQYMVNQWIPLTRYLDDPLLDFTNNLIESYWPIFGVGRRNWLVFETFRGGEHMAVLFSLIYSCHLNRINPYDYLCDVLARIPFHPADRCLELTPAHWSKLPPMNLREMQGEVSRRILWPGHPEHEIRLKEAMAAIEGRS
jgi:hypothetical protein